jgi:hypothetical protein
MQLSPTIGSILGRIQLRPRLWVRPYWWIRKGHPWSALLLLSWWWLWQRDRRSLLQFRLQQTFWAMNMQDVQTFLGDFVRPELWIM